jgi:UDP-glucose 4-epimerase
VGGAGFIGGHLAARLLADPSLLALTVFDNFSSGRESHLADLRRDPRISVVRGDVRDAEALLGAIQGHDTVVHLASNPDIARAATDPAIDFYQGTLLTHCVVEAMRLSGVSRILYASGSGVYGDLGDVEAREDDGPLLPISTYGASKLAGEALIASYCSMFQLSGCAFRLGNVVGPRPTHGVAYDFVRSLLSDPTTLTIRGDGTQSKPYIHVNDVIDAILLANSRATGPFQILNVAPSDYTTVKEIADMAVEFVVGQGSTTVYKFTGGDRGWKGDVPVVRLNTARIRSLGWSNRMSSGEAVRAAIQAMAADARLGRLT